MDYWSLEQDHCSNHHQDYHGMAEVVKQESVYQESGCQDAKPKTFNGKLRTS